MRDRKIESQIGAPKGRDNPLDIINKIASSNEDFFTLNSVETYELQIFAGEISQLDNLRNLINLDNLEEYSAFLNNMDSDDVVLKKCNKNFTLIHFIDFLVSSLSSKRLDHSVVSSILSIESSATSPIAITNNFYDNFNKFDILFLETNEFDFSSVQTQPSEQPKPVRNFFFFKRSASSEAKAHISPPIDDTVSVKKSSSSPEFSSDLDKQHMLAMIQKRFYSILHSKLLALINEFSECPYPYQSRINPTFINCLGQQIFLTSNYRLLNQYFDLLKSLTKHHQKMVLDVLCQVREESVTMANEIALSLDNELTKENKHPNRIASLTHLLNKFLNLLASLKASLIVPTLPKNSTTTLLVGEADASIPNNSQLIWNILTQRPANRQSLYAFILTSRIPSLISSLIKIEVVPKNLFEEHIIPIILTDETILTDESLMIEAMLSGICTPQQIKDFIIPSILKSANVKLLHHLLLLRDLITDPIRDKIFRVAIQHNDPVLFDHLLSQDFLTLDQISKLIPVIKKLNDPTVTWSLVHTLIKLENADLIKEAFSNNILNSNQINALTPIILNSSHNGLLVDILQCVTLTSSCLTDLLPVIKEIKNPEVTSALVQHLIQLEDADLLKDVFVNQMPNDKHIEALLPTIKKLNDRELTEAAFSLESLTPSQFIELLPLAKSDNSLALAVQRNYFLIDDKCISGILEKHGIAMIVAILDCDEIPADQLQKIFIPYQVSISVDGKPISLKTSICDYILSLGESEEQKKLMFRALKEIGIGKFFWTKSNTFSSYLVGPAPNAGELGRLFKVYDTRYKRPQENLDKDHSSISAPR